MSFPVCAISMSPPVGSQARIDRSLTAGVMPGPARLPWKTTCPALFKPDEPELETKELGMYAPVGRSGRFNSVPVCTISEAGPPDGRIHNDSLLTPLVMPAPVSVAASRMVPLLLARVTEPNPENVTPGIPGAASPFRQS